MSEPNRRPRFSALLSFCILLTASGFASGQRVSWPDPIAQDVLPYDTSGLTHGPLLGDITSRSVRVWVRTRQPVDFRVRFAKTLPLSRDTRYVTARTSAEADSTGTALLRDLEPNTRYFYGIEIDGQLADLRPSTDQAWPSFITLPDARSCLDPENNPAGLFNVTFAIGHCASQQIDLSGTPRLIVQAHIAISAGIVDHRQDQDQIYAQQII